MTRYLTIRAFVTVGDAKLGRELADAPVPDMLADSDTALFMAESVLRELVVPTAAEILKLLEAEPCPYDFSHTRQWCGNPLCRPS